MPAEITSSQSARDLALLRFAVLKSLEKQGLETTSNGLSTQGQTDLDFIFPRTTILAAVSHAIAVARDEHDSKVRSHGVYHLFRLPTFWEAQIHQAAGEAYQNPTLAAAETTGDLFQLLADLPALPSVAPPPQGSVDLGEIDLTNPDDLAKLAGTYRSALGVNNYVIPYFRLPKS